MKDKNDYILNKIYKNQLEFCTCLIIIYFNNIIFYLCIQKKIKFCGNIYTQIIIEKCQISHMHLNTECIFYILLLYFYK